MKFPSPNEYPKEIYIEDATYKVKFVKTIPHHSKKAVGLCDGQKQIIYIRAGQSPRGTFRTLVHECLHAIDFEYGVRLKHKHIYILELALEALLADNL